MEDNGDGMLNIYVLRDNLPSAISMLMIIRDNGFRLCHRIIAEKLLLMLHDADKQHMDAKYVIYPAVRDYVHTLYRIYGEENDRIDGILRELVIDRAIIDADDQKTKFSPLVAEIPNWTEKEALFRLLIEKFPENPHYYNHLARLLAFGDANTHIDPQYKTAIDEAKWAIEVAEKAGLSTSIHHTTLGCIYGQWLLHDLKEETRIRQRGGLALNYEKLIENISTRYSLACEAFECARAGSEAHDSFDYFPQIHMEYRIIGQMVAFDNARTLQQLVEQEPSFKLWYEEHFSIATELMMKMSDLLNSNASLLKNARCELGEISKNSNENIISDLQSLLSSSLSGSKRRRRALIYGAYVTNGCRWNGLDEKTRALAEQNLRKNFEDSDEGHKNADVETWFELYRRCKYFQAAEAQHILADFMEDSYKKAYLLFLLAFTQWEAGVAGSSPSAVNSCIREAQLLARQHGINTTREYDCFVNSGVTGCPVVPTADIARNGSRNPVGLKTFTGRIIEVEHTHGKILLDKLNLEVIFIPKPTTANKDEIKRDDIGSKVKLILMFSYSGLRGWDVVKLAE